MDITVITQLVTSVGFPIAMCLLIYYQNNKILANLKESIDNQTAFIQRLLDKIGVDKNV